MQTSDGVVIASVDGLGRFRSFQTIGLGTPQSFTSPNAKAVNLIVAPLAGEPFPDIVAVVPGSNEVAILRTGESGFAPVVRYATSGLTPVAVASGQFIGDAIPDLAIGHLNGSVTFLEGRADGTFALRADLTQKNHGTITSLTAADG